MGSGSMPEGVLPDGWVPADGDLAFEHATAGVAVCADRQPEDAVGATGAPCGWRVRYERRAGEATERRTVGAVTTRDAAVDALLSCMRRVSGGAAEPDAPTSVDGRWAALSTLAAGVTLHDSVPTADDEDGDGVDEPSYARSWATKLRDDVE